MQWARVIGGLPMRKPFKVPRQTAWAWLFFFLIFVLLYEGVHGLSKIRSRSCKGSDGRRGTCMFALECQQTEGQPLGTCMDGFLVGSCCGYNDKLNLVSRPLNHLPTTAQLPPLFSISLGVPITTTTRWNLFNATTAPTTTTYTSTALPVLPSGIITARPYRPKPIIIRKTTIKPFTIHTTLRTKPTGTSTIQTTTLTITTEKDNQLEENCGNPHVSPQSRVVGGSNSAFGAWPWQVSVRRTAFYGFASTHRCGGAVISSKWIATAGHCVDDLSLPQIRIRVGEYDFASVAEPFPYVERSAQRKVVHPKYNFYTYDNDLALVLLDRPLDLTLPHISPICLPSNDDLLVGKNATITGWGRLSEGGVLPTILQEVQVPIVSNNKCNEMFFTANRPETIPEFMMCAGYTNGGKDSCQGDSGGPMQVRSEDGRWFLAGIISWGIGCGDPNLPGVGTRISKFTSWILQNAS